MWQRVDDMKLNNKCTEQIRVRERARASRQPGGQTGLLCVGSGAVN